jgi:hypothetical protein
MSKQKRTKRTYECSDEDLVNFVGERSLEFETLRNSLAEQYAPDGPDEEGCIYQMAKRLFLKGSLPTMRTQMEGYNETETLDRFNDLLLAGASGGQVEHALDALGGRSGPHLRGKVPRNRFGSTEEWFEALKEEIFSVLMPLVIEFRLKEEQQPQHPTGKLSEDFLIRELAYEKALDESYDRTCRRLFEIKAAKRQITFRERLRFDRTHPGRLSGRVV